MRFYVPPSGLGVHFGNSGAAIGYHRRSLVETKMGCLKLLSERAMARDFDRQVAELQIRAALLNRFTYSGAPVTVTV